MSTNHVKHALSFLRTSCDGELNHMTQSDLAAKRVTQRVSVTRLHVPPALLLQRAINAAGEQTENTARAALRRPPAIGIDSPGRPRTAATQLAEPDGTRSVIVSKYKVVRWL